MTAEREEAINRIMTRTGKTREQTEAFLDLLGSAFARKGWAPGDPLTDEQITDKFNVFLGRDGGISGE